MDDLTQQVIAVVQYAIGGDVDAGTSTGNHDGFDSLGQIAVLDGLDERWPGVTSRNPSLSSAGSVAEIVAIVTADSP